jgi:hypothetical protein
VVEDRTIPSPMHSYDYFSSHWGVGVGGGGGASNRAGPDRRSE